MLDGPELPAGRALCAGLWPHVLRTAWHVTHAVRANLQADELPLEHIDGFWLALQLNLQGRSRERRGGHMRFRAGQRRSALQAVSLLGRRRGVRQRANASKAQRPSPAAKEVAPTLLNQVAHTGKLLLLACKLEQASSTRSIALSGRKRLVM